MDDSAHRERTHFFGQARWVAALTMVSRVLGLVRDMVIVPLGGAVVADRFWTAFSVPNLFRRLFGEGALSAAFVPVFTGVGESEGWERGRRVLANVGGVLAVVLAGLVVVIELGLWIIWMIWGGDWSRQVLLQLTAVMLPYMFTVCLLALGSAALQCRGRFTYPAAAPIVLNVGLIAAGAWIAPALGGSDEGQFFVIALAVVATGVVQLVGVMWLLDRAGFSATVRLRPLLPETKRIGKLMLPMLIPLSVLQFSAFADRLIALIFSASAQHPSLPLLPGVVRCLYAANRLYQLPMGVLGISVATVVFPLFSRYAARNDIRSLRDTANRALRLGAFLGIPAGVALIILARPIVHVFFQRGQFAPADTRRAAFILQMYCLGMCAYFWNHVLLRAFFSLRETREPLILACLLAGVNLVLVLGGIFTPLKGGAIGLATACTSSINALLLILMLRGRLGALGLRRIAVSIARTAIAAACMGAVVGAILWYCPRIVEPLVQGKGGTAIVLLASVLGGTAAFLASAAALRCPELADAFTTRSKTRDNAHPERAEEDV